MESDRENNMETGTETDIETDIETDVETDIETDMETDVEFCSDADVESNFFIQEPDRNSEFDSQSESNFEQIELNEFDFDVFAYIKTLNFKLRKWAVRNNIKSCALSELLKILKENGHRSLPMDARTRLETPVNVDVFKMGSGQCWYGGLKKKLTELCLKKNCSTVLELNIHIDGTPIYKSAKSEFWPIQCSVKGVNMKSFFVEIYKGASKPPSAEEFMRPFLNEVKDLLENGLPVLKNGETKMFHIRIDKFILDAIARQFLKCIIGHAGYFSCERCEERGVYLFKAEKNKKKPANGRASKLLTSKGRAGKGHVCLIGTNAPLRTDESFRNQENEEHHHDHSPLEELPIDMVRDIPLEYLHLIFYGIMKRLLTLWVNGTTKFKFSVSDIFEISKKHTEAGVTKPSEINKPNRLLKCLSFWKATEFRTFLLKTGPVVLRGHLTEEMYNHFLALHCAVTICCSESLKQYIPVAKSLSRSFTEKFGELYGNDNYTDSVHSLIHVTDDVERFGVFDEYSAFPGESNLGFFKSLVRVGHLPLQQVIKRMVERDLCDKICEMEDNVVETGKALHKGILCMEGIRLDSSEKNRWILTKNKEIFKIDRIIEKKNVIAMHGGILLKQNYENLYNLPIESKHLYIYQSKIDSEPMSITMDDVFCKLYRVELSDEKSAFLPLLHYTNNENA